MEDVVQLNPIHFYKKWSKMSKRNVEANMSKQKSHVKINGQYNIFLTYLKATKPVFK